MKRNEVFEQVSHRRNKNIPPNNYQLNMNLKGCQMCVAHEVDKICVL